ncbi:hypothetical protein T10_10711 [Trichinella papuae]|uniref:Uncharacterized protein n=1 Tax=Trichinella papuae TaxID=268474 RepID=A0A0V1MTM4_9BILA|nr:hypothetical protein T10_10711 [Trichinella papuae]
MVGSLSTEQVANSMSKLCLLLKFPRNSVSQDSSDINKRSNLKLDFKERLELPFVSIDNLTSPLSGTIWTRLFTMMDAFPLLMTSTSVTLARSKIRDQDSRSTTTKHQDEDGIQLDNKAGTLQENA